MIKIAKTELTLELEREIWSATAKQGVFGCFEVTIGWFGEERVDYLTYDTKGIWRCYEIKVSKSDFYSKAHNTFVGHYNYYVITKELYEQVKDEIPGHIGVYMGDSCVKRAKKQDLTIDEKILKDSLIRSLYREAEKVIKSENPTVVERLKRQASRAEKEAKDYRHKYFDLMKIGQEKYGLRWHKV
ncbi:hypothetical protein Dred_0923 [Desulforamulus reducens MI-1]|uniref:MmcB family DNA repair protein n=1 Tax=Desulforamulus reducens (strain ATCC BAA-1160 / DSM 100696 / MI-1) TaxID=349161 RepID=A4J306_DESRM|nr:hypothetical protein [Desulforamulus reducens]ABO49459.1 hypothetical protein Dred_0923 [Desulforamulus reducens MI-1]